MLTVRFSTGFSIQYNEANYAVRNGEYTDLYDKKGGRLFAQVPTRECVIEFVAPCRTYSAATEPSLVAKAFLSVVSDADLRHTLSVYDLAKIKAALKPFDARRSRWGA